MSDLSEEKKLIYTNVDCLICNDIKILHCESNIFIDNYIANMIGLDNDGCACVCLKCKYVYYLCNNCLDRPSNTTFAMRCGGVNENSNVVICQIISYVDETDKYYDEEKDEYIYTDVSAKNIYCLHSDKGKPDINDIFGACGGIPSLWRCNKCNNVHSINDK